MEKAKVLGYLNPPSSMGNPESTVAGETTTSDVLKVTPEQVQELLKSSNNSFGNKKPKNQTFSCTSCCVQVTSQASFEAHLSSKRHRKNKHKFHTYPGISKESVKEKYVNNFVRAGTLGNEFTDKSKKHLFKNLKRTCPQIKFLFQMSYSIVKNVTARCKQSSNWKVRIYAKSV